MAVSVYAESNDNIIIEADIDGVRQMSNTAIPAARKFPPHSPPGYVFLNLKV